MIMSPLIAFLIVFVLLLIALIKLKVTPSVGLFAAAIIFGLMVGMPAADILSKLPAGFGNMMTSIGLLIVFGSIFGDFLGNSGATEELAKGMVRLFGKKNDYLALNLVGLHPLHPHLLRLCLHHDGPAGDCLAEDQQKEHEGLCHRHLYRPDAYPQLRRTYSRPSGRRRPDWRERRLVHHLGHHRLPARQPPRGLGVCEPRQLEGRKAARPATR